MGWEADMLEEDEEDAGEGEGRSGRRARGTMLAAEGEEEEEAGLVDIAGNESLLERVRERGGG